MSSLRTPKKKARVRRMGPTQRATTTNRGTSYNPIERSSSEKSENLRLCAIQGCAEPRLDRSCFCRQHHAEYRAWEEPERQRKIKELLEASTPAERKRIRRARAEGLALRKLAEALSC